ncbi:hypothetical protein CPZ29_21770 [Klebsiella oxytoca]|nr:hypothetical protein CPZ29_21770 [Klebsiella oxytoca]PHH17157.1 hypothetical protein CRX54_11300 [Klebsiella oxytoca]
MTPASAVPLRAGVASLVRSPLVSGPVCPATSSVTCRPLTGVTVVSTVISNAGERSLTFPALSVTVVLRLWSPSFRVSGVKVQRPSSPATTVPSTVSPS